MDMKTYNDEDMEVLNISIPNNPRIQLPEKYIWIISTPTIIPQESLLTVDRK